MDEVRMGQVGLVAPFIELTLRRGLVVLGRFIKELSRRFLQHSHRKGIPKPPLLRCIKHTTS